MDPLGLTLAAVVGLGIGALGGSLLAQSRERAQRELDKAAAKDDASSLLQRARDEAENLRRSGELEGKEEAMRLRDTWDQEEGKRREEAELLERRLVERSESLDRKFDALNERELGQERRSQEVERREADLLKRDSEIDRLVEERRRRLEALADMTAQEARKNLIEDLQDEARAVAANAVREIKDEAQRTGEREAKKIIALAIQRMAAEQTAVTTVSVVQLPSDEMKGRIIGREGRNIRSFEQATGIDVIIDDTPEAVVLSGFDPVRREVARIALEQLIEDGRIHPGRIEEMVQKAAKEVDKSMVEAAEEVLYELGIHNVHPEIVKVLGRLRFRSSYGQNQLHHAKEVAILAGSMAAEMKLEVDAAKRAGVLHDVGKGLTHEQEGTHVELGWRLCKKHNESDVVLNAIKAHHDEEPHYFPETFLVTAADAISGSRPGARREMFEGYVKRLEKLEGIAMDHPGVERCFAIQAGRELRVMVVPEKVSDAEMTQLSEVIARKIEGELQYPGQIKVVVVRETRAVDLAR
ncbi:MAG TPA: ribonuclease Y [Gemmatimonadetes bacterium]|mgnify:CR=1 FL=1|nr:ribonuclease Y [Gemmatimonadota bacterium]|tara:strand:+ start:3063 stop:4637 length:1575 start_codon:yes stop_codon:yes gene_type:complete